jgi:hypothetical protein
MEDRKLLRYLPPFLRNVPNFGAFIAAAITLLAWAIWLLLSISPTFPGESGGIILICTVPVMHLGLTVEVALARALGFDLTSHPYITYLLAFIFTVGGNVVAVWLLLKLITTVTRRFPQQETGK